MTVVAHRQERGPQRTGRGAPKLEARLAGAAYLYIVAAGLFVELAVRSALVAPRDAAATAASILGAEQLYRAGFVAEQMMLACDVIVAVLLYRVLRPAGETLALLAAAFRLTMAAMLGVNALNHFDPIVWFEHAGAAHELSAAHVQELALHALHVQAAGYSAGLLFFGFSCLFAGAVIMRATFLPRLLGWLLVLAGVCYLVNSLAGFLAPGFARALFPYILVPCLIAELSLGLWLLMAGVNDARWREQARRSAG